MRGTLGRTSALITLVALPTLPPSALATYDPIGTGKAQILLDRGFASFLARDGIKLSAKAGARRHGRNLAFQVGGGGNLDPTIGMGEIEAEGTLRTKVPFREIRARTKHDTLIAKRSTRRGGFGTTYSARS